MTSLPYLEERERERRKRTLNTITNVMEIQLDSMQKEAKRSNKNMSSVTYHCSKQYWQYYLWNQRQWISSPEWHYKINSPQRAFETEDSRMVTTSTMQFPCWCWLLLTFCGWSLGEGGGGRTEQPWQVTEASITTRFHPVAVMTFHKLLSSARLRLFVPHQPLFSSLSGEEEEKTEF